MIWALTFGMLPGMLPDRILCQLVAELAIEWVALYCAVFLSGAKGEKQTKNAKHISKTS